MLKKILLHNNINDWRRVGFWASTVIIGLVCLGIITFAGGIAILSIGLPDVSKLENLAAAQSTQIFDRDGVLLYTIHGEENREYVPLDKISAFVPDATVAIEDDSFWEHGGFDLLAIAKAAAHEIFGIGTARGGSTITQQYIKNTFLSSERSYLRKAKELILAVRLERAYDKKKILELYLNRIPYGNNAYGIQKAAEIYLNKGAKDLTLGESAVLAALPQAPTRYNPYSDNKFSHLLKQFTTEELYYRNIKGETDLKTEEYARGLIGAFVDLGNGKKIYIQGRSDLVLKRMYELGKITADQRKKALNEIQGLKFNDYKEFIKHAHFVLYVKEMLEQKYGKEVVEQGGLKVYTTIDGKLQDYAEKVVSEKGEYDVKAYGTNNAALLTINAKTGEILAMVGSRDYYNEEIDGNVNVVLRPRQPGSSFKPIVYTQLFYNGYGPGTIIEDVPTKIGTTDQPSNFDGRWLGQISIRRALGQSRNIPAIKAYFLSGQEAPIIDLATRMGITTLDKKRDYGYPLAIGAGEIPLIDMVTAYGVFANNGKKPELTPILKVVNSNGDILEEKKPKDFEQVVDPQIAYLINSILSDRSVSVGSRMYIDGKINAAKTGTSTKENKKDAASAGNTVRPSDGWIIGYTPTIVTGVWIGNTDGSGLGYTADGYNTAAPIFNDVMTKALENTPAEPFPEPEGIKHIQISKASGKLPGATTPAAMIISEIFAGSNVPTETENQFYKVKIDKISELLATEFTPKDAILDVTFQNYQPIANLFNWKQELLDYYKRKQDDAKQNGPQPGDAPLPEAAPGEEIRPGTPPTTYDNIHTAETAKNAPLINIINPVAQTSVSQGNLSVNVDIKGANGIQTVEYYLDNDKKYFIGTAPFTGHVIISKTMVPDSTHLIVAKVVDKLGYSAQSAIEIKIAGTGSTGTSSTGTPETPSPLDSPKPVTVK